MIAVPWQGISKFVRHASRTMHFSDRWWHKFVVWCDDTTDLLKHLCIVAHGNELPHSDFRCILLRLWISCCSNEISYSQPRGRPTWSDTASPYNTGLAWRKISSFIFSDVSLQVSWHNYRNNASIAHVTSSVMLFICVIAAPTGA